MSVNSRLFKDKCRFVLSPRYELFLSLASIAEANANENLLLKEWQKPIDDFLGNLRPEIRQGLQFVSDFPALLPTMEANWDVEKIFQYLEGMDNKKFIYLTLEGWLHDKGLCEKLVDGKTTLKNAINKSTPQKREWLAHVKLFPYDAGEPTIQFLEWFIKEPKKAQSELIETCRDWWKKIFSKIWNSTQRNYEESIRKHEQFLRLLDFEEFSKKALLKIRIGTDSNSIEAMRGGYKISCDEIERVFFIPSAFNSDRLWSALHRPKEPTVVYFPYLELDLVAPISKTSKKSELDPALMCRALGDPTRFAIVTLLSKEPKPAVALAQDLELTRATLSHHVSILREAKVLEDDPTTRALKINWEEVSSLSNVLVNQLKSNERRKK